MFNLKDFCENARSGKDIDEREIIQYLSSFENIVIWGAGNLGTAIGKVLLDKNVRISKYWDKKFESIKVCNGISVEDTFSRRYDSDKTCIIGCIVNGSLGEDWVRNTVKQQGYTYYLSGMTLYEGIVCPLNDKYFNITECTKRKACSLCNCERYINLLQKELCYAEISLQLLTFIISTRCTLKCKYCGQRLALYKNADKVDFEAESVMRDFDKVMDNIDFVGMISVIGGEPFLHPKIDQIINHMLKRGNFGVINITTNGVVKISRETLENIKSDRVKISFSIYDSYLAEKQKNMIKQNIDLVNEVGIINSCSKPLWVIPSDIKACDYTEKELREKKSNCDGIRMQMSVKNGFIYSCGIADSMEGLNIAEVGTGRIDIYDDSFSRTTMKKWLQIPFYDCCKYCYSSEAIEIVAGEQI